MAALYPIEGALSYTTGWDTIDGRPWFKPWNIKSEVEFEGGGQEAKGNGRSAYDEDDGPQPISQRIVDEQRAARRASEALRQELSNCRLNGTTAETEADRVLRRLPGLHREFIAHLRVALGQSVDNPVDYAMEKAHRGDRGPEFDRQFEEMRRTQGVGAA